MTTAHDVYAETNPAFCAAALARFCDAHVGYNELSPALPVVYLVLPIILSGDLSHTFHGSNKNTGLLVWLERYPHVLDGLSARVNSTLHITTNALRFGCIAGILNLKNDGCVVSTNRVGLGKKALADDTFARARLLGCWFAGAGSARAVIEAMGVSV